LFFQYRRQTAYEAKRFPSMRPRVVSDFRKERIGIQVASHHVADPMQIRS
jgi:hypothetical protein